MISSNTTVTPRRPTDQEVDAFISANPNASDDDIHAFMLGQTPSNPERFNPIDMLAAPFMGFSKGATWGLSGRINRDYQKEVQSEHPILYNAGQLGGMMLGGSAEVKGLQAAGRTIAGVVPKVANAIRGTSTAAKAARVAGRTTHAATTGALQAAGEGGTEDAATGAVAGSVFSLGMEGLLNAGGWAGRLAGRRDYLDMVGTILNKKHDDAEELLSSLTGIRRANADMAYRRALDGKFTADPEILKIFQDPDIRSAYQQFADLQRQKAALGQSFIPTPDPSVIDLYMQTGGNPKAATVLGQGIPLRVIHELSEELRAGNIRNVVDQSPSALKKGVSKKILDALDDAEKRIGQVVPEYAAADLMYAKDSRAIHALNAGRGRLNDNDAEAVKLAKKYAGDIPVFQRNTAAEIARWAKTAREKGLAGDEDAIRDLDHYAIGVYTWLKEQVENHGQKVLAKPEMRNKIAALSGGDPNAAIQFYKAVTSGKERAADLATMAVWGASGHPYMAVHAAHRAVTKASKQHAAPDVFLDYLGRGSANPQDIMDKVNLLHRAELYRPRRRAATTAAAKAGGAMMGNE